MVLFIYICVRINFSLCSAIEKLILNYNNSNVRDFDSTTSKIPFLFNMNNEVEIWKDIPGYEGLYQCSNLGNIKSFHKCKHGMIMKSNKYGRYKSIILTNKSAEKTYYVHTLVALSFLKHKSELNLVVDHIDNNPLNNNIENIRYISHRENISKDKKNSTSKYTGVYYIKSRNKYRSIIQINGKQKHIGYFTNEFDAHLSYIDKLNKI